MGNTETKQTNEAIHKTTRQQTTKHEIINTVQNTGELDEQQETQDNANNAK